MGGFEGGDEAGFWEISENNFLEKTSKAQSEKKYQIIQEGSLYKIIAYESNQTIIFIPFHSMKLTVEGYKTDIITKVYNTLLEFTDDMEIIEFFHEYKVFIETSQSPKIDEKVLGILFLLLTKDVCNLVLNENELKEILNTIETDITLLL
jgi:hypothetical protein